MKPLLLLFLFVTLTIHPQTAFADRYDDEYAAEQAGKRLADRINAQEEAGREAAKQRYDKEHPSSSGGGGGGGGMLLIWIIAIVGLTIHKCFSSGGMRTRNTINQDFKKKVAKRPPLRRFSKADKEKAAKWVEDMKAQREAFSSRFPAVTQQMLQEHLIRKPLNSETPLSREAELKIMRSQQKQKEHKERQRLEKKRLDAERAEHEARCTELEKKSAKEEAEKRAKEDAELAEWRKRQLSGQQKRQVEKADGPSLTDEEKRLLTIRRIMEKENKFDK